VIPLYAIGELQDEQDHDKSSALTPLALGLHEYKLQGLKLQGLKLRRLTLRDLTWRIQHQ
jgi:hypothetical protein